MLHALRGVLLERGIYIPSIWNAAPDVPSHMRLVMAIRKGDVALVQAQLEDILAQGHRYVVISCEGLSTFTTEQVVLLRRLLGLIPTQIIHYVRRWPERVPSAWQEHVRQGQTTTLPEFLVRQTMGQDGFARPDSAILDPFAAIFGAEQIKIVSYSSLVEGKLDIARHFLASFLGVTDIALPDIGRPNQSLSTLDTELIRVLNTIRAPSGSEWSTAISGWYLAQKPGLVPASVLDAMQDCMGAIRLDETTPPVIHLSRDVVTRYAGAIVPPFEDRTLHALHAVDAAFIRPDYLLKPAVPKCLRDIYRMYLSASHAPPFVSISDLTPAHCGKPG